MTLHRFHVPGVRPGAMDLPEGARVHATRVLRLAKGDELRVFDAGEEFMAVMVSIEKHRATIEVGGAAPALPERTVRLHLVMSPLKGDLTELVIQKATELGVSRITPAVFERTDTVARRDPSEGRRERWSRVAVSASEQSGRAVVPVMDPVTTLAACLATLRPRKTTELRFMGAEPSLPLNEADDSAGVEISEVRLAIGPSGGLSAADIALLQSAEFKGRRFAPHTLRSETACIAAVAILGDRFR